MKPKPDTEAFKPGKDPSAFIEAAEPASPSPARRRVHREQKIFRLPFDLIQALKREAFERSMQSGVRVTETELVEQSLRAYLKR